MVACMIWDHVVVGSSPVTPTTTFNTQNERGSTFYNQLLGYKIDIVNMVAIKQQVLQITEVKMRLKPVVNFLSGRFWGIA